MPGGMVAGRASRAWGEIWDRAGMWVVFASLFAVLAATVPNFTRPTNLVGLALSVSLVGMVACTMLFCMVSGDFDLSVESVVACSGVVSAVVVSAASAPCVRLIGAGAMADLLGVGAGVLAGMAAGGVVGAANGLIIARLGINPLIATLGTMQIVKGLALMVSGGVAVGVSNQYFDALGNAYILGLPAPILLTALCFGAFGVLLHTTRYGRRSLAIGGNREAARLAGIPVTSTRILIFVAQGLMAGLAGVVLASRLTSGQPNTSAGFSLDVIAACVLGGVSLSGGIGSMAGVIVGVLIMGTVQNALNLLNVPSFWQYVVRGVILLAAVLFDRLRRRGVTVAA